MDKTFLFYIPGSMGSLLATLIRSQMESDFSFNGFNEDNAHEYIKYAYSNTHNYTDYMAFKNKGVTLESHLEQNKTGHDVPQTLDIHWAEEFYGKSDMQLVVCYLSDMEQVINNYVSKVYSLKDIPEIAHQFVSDKIKIKPDHPQFEHIDALQITLHFLKEQRRVLNKHQNIDMLKVLDNDYREFEAICEIKNMALLDHIVESYKKKQVVRPTPIGKDLIKIMERITRNSK